ncbi:protein kinase [Streptomyces sp. NPDC088812]|uniref:protein kinase domain-containing protein n=1 Tax=Streptomyces sp. NPDC088812 TaxID=3365905 RepID=UPI00381BA6EC
MEPLREDDPERIGGHRLLALLGQGGWGNVYFARTDGGRSIALKTIRPDRLQEDSARFRRRFAREVEAAKAVDPKHTAEVVDFDTRAPEPWLATRYVAGVNLAEALEHCGGPLPLRTWRVLAAGLTDALRSIHRAGLVHRDLKLANILLAADGASVIDFGIARHLAPEDGASLTATGATPRTTTFASPEQLRDERVGPAGDVFALGLVLGYTALNRHPFGTGSTMQIGAGILTGRPSLDGLPPTVRKIVLPCLEPKPQDRPEPAEVAVLLSADAPSNAKDWLPPGVRAEIDERSRFAIDTEHPLRPRPHGHVRPSPADTPSGVPYDPTPAEQRSAPHARPLRERELSTAPPARPGADTTTLPPPAAKPEVRLAEKKPKVAPAALRASAEAGNAEAMRQLAARHKSAGDVESALLWYRRAADSGNPTGAREAGQLLEKHFPERRAQILALYRAAAAAGEDFARTRLTALLGTEQGKAEQEKKVPAPQRNGRNAGAKQTEKAAAPQQNGKAAAPQQNGKAVVRTGAAPTRGPAPGADAQVGRAPLSPAEQALLSEHRASALEGRIKSILAIANWYKQQKRDESALVWYWRAAEAGHEHSMHVTAQLLEKDPDRWNESLDWYRKAAETGNVAAMVRAGRLLLRADRPTEALDHFRTAAAKGHVNSMVETARILEQTGQPDRALEWLARATAQGSTAAAKEADRLRAALRRTSPPPPEAAPPPKAPPSPKPTTAPKPTPAPKPTHAPKPTPAPKATTPPKPTPAPKAAPPPKAEPPQKNTPARVKPKSDTVSKGGRPSVSWLRKEAAAHEREGRLQKALDGYVEAADQGDVASRRDVARLCLRLHDHSADADVRRRLKKRALRLYRKLAEEGDQPSILVLAELDGEARTHAETQVQAAEAGSIKAMRAVARTQLRAGTDDSFQEALRWLHAAAGRGSTGAMLDGARAYEDRGRYREALEWYRWALDSGDRAAVPHIERLEAEHPGTALMHRWSRRLRRAWS